MIFVCNQLNIFFLPQINGKFYYLLCYNVSNIMFSLRLNTNNILKMNKMNMMFIQINSILRSINVASINELYYICGVIACEAFSKYISVFMPIARSFLKYLPPLAFYGQGKSNLAICSQNSLLEILINNHQFINSLLFVLTEHIDKLWQCKSEK